MADTPPAVKQESLMPYVWAVLILFLIGTMLIFGVLYLRPAFDPMVVIASVMGFVITAMTGVAAFLKSDTTHRTVNSELTEWKQEVRAFEYARGKIAGAETEQARTIEEKRVAALTGVVTGATGATGAAAVSVPAVASVTAAPPIDVHIVAPDPLPVVEVKK